MQELQHSLGNRFQWFRLGLISATVMTPLVSRWQSLRAAERAWALWEARQTASRLPWAHRTAGEAELAPLARKSNPSAGIWLAGVLVGLIVAGTATYALARRRQQSDGELLELPWAQANGKAPHSAEQARHVLGRAWHTPGASGQQERSAMSSAAPGASATTPQANGAATGEQQAIAGVAATREGTPLDGAIEPDTAPIIGNTRTMVYHEAGDVNLPTEENRIYFASAQEAEARGYRAGRGEVGGTES
jgi:hypothetical protein